MNFSSNFFALRLKMFMDKEKESYSQSSSVCVSVLDTVCDVNQSKTAVGSHEVTACGGLKCSSTETDRKKQICFLKTLISYISVDAVTAREESNERVWEALDVLVLTYNHYLSCFDTCTDEEKQLRTRLFSTILDKLFERRNGNSIGKDHVGVIFKVFDEEIVKVYLNKTAAALYCQVKESDGHNLVDSWSELLSRWKRVYKDTVDFLETNFPGLAQQDESYRKDHICRIYEVLSTRMLEFQSNLKEVSEGQSPILQVKEFSALCQLLVVLSQLSTKLREFNANCSICRRHQTDDIKDLESESCERKEPEVSETTNVEGEPLGSCFESTLFMPEEEPEELSSWPDFPEKKDLKPEKLRSVLKNNTDDYPTDRSANCDHSSAQNMNLLHQLHSSAQFNSQMTKLFITNVRSAMSQVRLSTAPISVDLVPLMDTALNFLDDACGSRISLCLQPALFASSVHGPLFTTPEISIVEQSSDDSGAGGDQLICPGMAIHSSMSAWVGSVGTGAGLPFPVISVSESVKNFVSLIISSVIPGLLSVMEDDLQNSHPYTLSCAQQCDREHAIGTHRSAGDPPSTASHSTKCMNCEFTTTNFNRETRDNFKTLVTSVLGSLLSFLDGKRPPRSLFSSTDVLEVPLQIAELIISVENNMEGLERLAVCISDCLLLRSMCHTLSCVFNNRFKIPMSLVAESSTFPPHDELSSHLAELCKQYDSTVRVIAERIIDMALEIWMETTADLELASLKCVANKSEAEVNWNSTKPEICSQKVWLLYQHLKRLWIILSRTCPAGLARQILAYLSSQSLNSVVQQLTTPECMLIAEQNYLYNDLLILLKIAQICLFTSAETVSEIVGVGQLPVDINGLHTVGTLLTQITLCWYSPEDVWESLHKGGYYRKIVEDQLPFEYARSNWLRFANPYLFDDVPFMLMERRRPETEVKIEWELFAASSHFDPVRLLSLITSWDAKLSTDILTHPKFSSQTISHSEIEVAANVFTTLFHVCALIPNLEMFHSNVLTRVFPDTQSLTLLTMDTLPEYNYWPAWLRGILRLIDEPLNKLWGRFKQLTELRVNADESLSVKSLIARLDETPRKILADHHPQSRRFWSQLFPAGHLPCGCPFHKPSALNPGSVSNPLDQNATEPDDQPDRSTLSYTPRTTNGSKWKREQDIGAYSSYYLEGGHNHQAWCELACDLLRMTVLAFPLGIQLAFGPLEELFCDFVCQPNVQSYFRGGCLAVHLVMLGLHHRILTELRPQTGIKSASPREQARLLQHLILFEYLSLILDSDKGEVFECKKRVLSFSEEVRSTQSYPEQATQSSASRTFQLSQYVRTVQQFALPDLYFLNRFFKRNIQWIRTLLENKSDKASYEPRLDELEPDGTDDKDELTAQLAMYKDADWTNLCSVNYGLTRDTIQDLRSQFSSWKNRSGKTENLIHFEV